MKWHGSIGTAENTLWDRKEERPWDGQREIGNRRSSDGYRLGKAARKKLVRAEEELHILTADDAAYIMDLTHTEAQVRARYTTPRQQ